MAGYSGTPLVKKLGIKTGFRMYTQGMPPDYDTWLDPLPLGVHITHRLSGKFDFMHLFVKDQNTLKASLAKAQKFLKSDGMVWVSWPKKSSGITTELNESIIRDHGLRSGLVDIKVCAVDEIWSGLKFVIPVSQRPK